MMMMMTTDERGQFFFTQPTNDTDTAQSNPPAIYVYT